MNDTVTTRKVGDFMENRTTVDFSALRQALGVKSNQAEWIKKEKTEDLQFGGSLTIRGWVCSNCGFFRRKKHGISKFCEDCGSAMKGEEV